MPRIDVRRMPDETHDEATLRLQIAKADGAELQRDKLQLELDEARGRLVSKQSAVDLAQAAMLRVTTALDALPSELLDEGLSPAVVEVVEACIERMRARISAGA